MVQQGWSKILQQTKGRPVFLLVCLLCMMAFIFFLFWQGAGVKQLYLVVDGETTEVKTKQTMVKNILLEEDVSLGLYDTMSHPLYSSVEDEDRIVIERARPVKLNIGGQVETKYTTASTVQEALEQWNISLDADDEVQPGLEEPLVSTLQIDRIKRIVEEVTEVVPYETVNKDDPTLVKGKTHVIQNGQEGKLTRKIEKVYKNEVFVKENVIEEITDTPSVNKIVAVGTKPPVTILSSSSPDVNRMTKDGVSFGVKKTMDNFELTAYDAGFNSTGKNPGDPMHGITFSGAKVKAGQTIAVDPKVIPLNWWIYIEGIGFRKAEDTGSAIKGKRIDVYMTTEKSALQFGRQYGYTVHVIGPEKPAGLK